MGLGAAVAGSAVAGLAGSLISSSAAKSAAAGQTAAANNASNNTLAQYQQTRADLAPFVQMGTSAGNTLTNQLPSLTAPTSMTEADLVNTPGYQFNLSQGLEGVQNSASARGLGVSGAAMKGAANYATGLADSTYQNQFNNDQTNKNAAFNKLLAVTGVGQNAAAQTGTQGLTATQNAGNFSTSGANAAASGTVGAANAGVSGINDVSNAFMTNALLNKLYPSGSGSGSGGLS